MVYLPNTIPNTEYSPYFIIQHHVQYFAGGYRIKTAKVAYKDKSYSREIKMSYLKPYYFNQMKPPKYIYGEMS